jgi:hypothetical protein
MVEQDSWAPEGIDPEKPSASRIYDYYLGGAHNFAVDREVAKQVIAAWPDGLHIARANRAFLQRAVRFLVDAGIRQFLDIGSGIPTVGNVHEIAQGAAPDARVVYVDTDPVAVAHSHSILAGNDLAEVIQEDLRRPERILEHPDVRRLLDLDQPVAVLVVGLVHFLPDEDDPAGVLARLRAPLAAGSHLALSHLTADSRPELARKAEEVYRGADVHFTWRSRAQVEALFAGWELVEPGLVWVPQWRPEAPEQVGDDPTSSANYGGVGRKA